MAAEQLSLTDILSDEKKEPEAPAPAEAPAEAAAELDAAARESAEEQRREDYKSRRNKARDKEAIAQGKVRDPATGQYVSPKEVTAEPAAAAPAAPVEKPAEPAKPAAAAAPQQPEFTEREKAFLRAAQEERGKRQERERELDALRSGKPAPGAATEPAKTFWDDPDAALAKSRQETEHMVVNARLNVAETIARSRHADFDDKVSVFRKVLTDAGANAGPLAQQWLASPDPAMFAYNYGKNHIELTQVGNLDAMREKIRKDTEIEVRAKVEAEFKAKSDAQDKERAALPPSLSDARAGTSNRPTWSGPPSFDDILKP